MTPLIELITSTVARKTWTVDYGQTGASPSDGKSGATAASVAPSRTVGTITPFFLSISLIIRHTGEVHDDVANLLRLLRRWDESRERSRATGEADRDRQGPGASARPGEPESRSPGGSTPDRNARIRRLVDELRREVESLAPDSR